MSRPATRRAWPVLGALVVAALLVVVAAPTYYVNLAVLALVYSLLAMSLNLLMGYAGLTSFGHAAFFGAAAYAAGILSLRYGVPFWPAAAAGIAVGTLLGAAYGILVAGSRGVYFLLITLALGQVTWGLTLRWVSMTGGDNGLPGITRPDLWLGWPLADVRGYYLFALLIVGICVALLALVVASPFGHALRGIRESPSRMRTLGYPVWGYAYAAFVVSAFFASVAGVLYVYYNGFVSHQNMQIAVSAQVALMVIIGGAGSFWGPAAGATLLVFMQNLLSSVTQRWMSVLGLLYIVVVLYQPSGLAGLVTQIRRRRAGRPEERVATPAVLPTAGDRNGWGR
ncbi:MAG: branched-chain amino acid ABC transporter permease [Armatimonadota bacterium]|nr:branched-chain amino acid ABC transporter permease [Armatimonadota bacterium]